MDFEQRLAATGLRLPPAQLPSGNYLTYRLVGHTLYLAGHGPRTLDGQYVCGQIANESDIARGYQAARQTALNMLATIKSAIGTLDRVDSFVKILGLVNAHPGFKHHPKVIDGFSDVLLEVFGEAGRHARSAVGMSSLPHGMTVEVEGILLLRN